jgi:hypothetical protein
VRDGEGGEVALTGGVASAACTVAGHIRGEMRGVTMTDRSYAHF